MINGMNILGLIPARGGSKSIPRKNIRNLNGKPLLAWTVEAAKKSSLIDRLVLSTDDHEIAKIGKAHGCDVPFIRPSHLATDKTSTYAVARHAIAELPKFDLIVLLQPTSPLRRCIDIDSCIEKCVSTGAKSCVSVCKAPEPPQWLYYRDPDDRLTKVCPDLPDASRRQDARTAYVLNGAVFVSQVSWLLQKEGFVTENAVSYCMPEERAIDVDSDYDLRLASLLMQSEGSDDPSPG